LFCLLFGIGIYGIYVEPSRLEVRHVQVNNDEMGKILQEKVVLQISDVHLRAIGSNETRLLKTIEALRPDFIFLTGDYIRWNGAYERALDFLSKVKAKNGVWAVMGDYDYSNSRKSCLFCHKPGTGKPTERHGVKFLRNSFDRIDTQTGTLWIGGLDGTRDDVLLDNARTFFLKGKEPAIVLSHSPLAFDLIDNNQNVLVLAGDTHGGQIPLPSWLWRLLGYKKNARYEQRWLEKGRNKMYVSRGVGTSHIPIRLLRLPEITVFHFGKDRR
jgi:predicted MPP superfamily phosphohydrolase